MTRVPMVGKGTFADPKRPMYAPLPSAINPASKTGIIGFTYQVSDDGNYALAEFVARDRAAFRQILADTSPEVKSFVRGVHKREDIEAEFKKMGMCFTQVGPTACGFAFLRLPVW